MKITQLRGIGDALKRKDARTAEEKYEKPHLDPREDQSIIPHNN